MARVLTENVAVSVAREDATGALPGSPSWLRLQMNNLTNWGATFKTVERDFIDNTRQYADGVITDVDSAPTLDMDLTVEHLNEFAEGAMFATRQGAARFVPTAVTSTGFTVASGGALAQYQLVHARGFVKTANNGLHVVGASSTGTEVKTSGLVAEAAIPAAQNVSLEIAGQQFASGDVTMDSSGNLLSTVFDFTTLALKPGQFVKIGGTVSGSAFTGTAANNFYARIAASTPIATHKITFDWRSTAAFATDAGAAKTIHLYFGQFLWNAEPDAAEYLERSCRLEAAFPDLGNASEDMWEYAKYNFINTLTLNLAGQDKATMQLALVGSDTDVPTTTQATNASTPRLPVSTAGFNTSGDFARLRFANIDESGQTTYLKGLTVKLDNGLKPDKYLGTLGAIFINRGKLKVTLDGDMLFDSPDVITAIRNRTAMAFQVGLKNADGGFFLDVPSLRIEQGPRELPRGESVRVKLSMMARGDATLGYSASLSFFPYLPAS